MSDTRPALVDVLEHYDVPTKDRNSYMTRCPLHEDRTPSLSVNVDKEVWRCHSCGEAGDSLTLIMKKEGVDYLRARALAATLGFAAGSAGGSDESLSGSAYGRRRKVPAGKGPHSRDGAYVPAWRRR